MIEFLRGTIIAKGEGHLIIDCQGVGYGLDCTQTTLAAVPSPGLAALGAGGEPATATAPQVSLHCYLHVAEGVMRLFGFSTADERELFLLVMSVGGIGPKLALAVLNRFTPLQFVQAVAVKNISALTSVSGIGKKGAERMIVELSDKVKKFRFAAPVGGPGGSHPVDGSPLAVAGGGAGANVFGGFIGEEADALEGLIKLGTKPAIAERALGHALEVLGAGASAAELIREALKHRNK